MCDAYFIPEIGQSLNLLVLIFKHYNKSKKNEQKNKENKSKKQSGFELFLLFFDDLLFELVNCKHTKSKNSGANPQPHSIVPFSHSLSNANKCANNTLARAAKC